MKKKPEILNRTVLAQSRLFDIESVHLRFSNGQERHFERIAGRNPSSVMVVPMPDEKTVLLIREYGAGVEDYVLAFPKGAVEGDEDIFSTALRELKEEVGYGARKFEKIGQFSASPGYLGSMMQVVLATDLYHEPMPGDEPEPMEVVPWKLDAIDPLIAHPEFHEARSIAALLMLERLRRG